MKRFRFRLAWWLEGCPFTGWKDASKIPWDYRLGMWIMPNR